MPRARVNPSLWSDPQELYEHYYHTDQPDPDIHLVVVSTPVLFLQRSEEIGKQRKTAVDVRYHFWFVDSVGSLSSSYAKN